MGLATVSKSMRLAHPAFWTEPPLLDGHDEVHGILRLTKHPDVPVANRDVLD
jgi:hypothetical protein